LGCSEESGVNLTEAIEQTGNTFSGQCIKPKMAFVDWEQEYHLTPEGWVPGSSYVLGEVAAEVEPPDDRVLTMVEQSRLVAGPSGEVSTWRYDWKAPEIIPDDLDRLLAVFGHRPSPD
jgi:hypothetical protein